MESHLGLLPKDEDVQLVDYSEDSLSKNQIFISPLVGVRSFLSLVQDFSLEVSSQLHVHLEGHINGEVSSPDNN
jgi:hypothetical protein